MLACLQAVANRIDQHASRAQRGLPLDASMPPPPSSSDMDAYNRQQQQASQQQPGPLQSASFKDLAGPMNLAGQERYGVADKENGNGKGQPAPLPVSRSS